MSTELELTEEQLAWFLKIAKFKLVTSKKEYFNPRTVELFVDREHFEPVFLNQVVEEFYGGDEKKFWEEVKRLQIIENEQKGFHEASLVIQEEQNLGCIEETKQAFVDSTKTSEEVKQPIGENTESSGKRVIFYSQTVGSLEHPIEIDIEHATHLDEGKIVKDERESNEHLQLRFNQGRFNQWIDLIKAGKQSDKMDRVFQEMEKHRKIEQKMIQESSLLPVDNPVAIDSKDEKIETQPGSSEPTNPPIVEEKKPGLGAKEDTSTQGKKSTKSQEKPKRRKNLDEDKSKVDSTPESALDVDLQAMFPEEPNHGKGDPDGSITLNLELSPEEYYRCSRSLNLESIDLMQEHLITYLKQLPEPIEIYVPRVDKDVEGHAQFASELLKKNGVVNTEDFDNLIRRKDGEILSALKKKGDRESYLIGSSIIHFMIEYQEAEIELGADTTSTYNDIILDFARGKYVFSDSAMQRLQTDLFDFGQQGIDILGEKPSETDIIFAREIATTCLQLVNFFEVPDKSDAFGLMIQICDYRLSPNEEAFKQLKLAECNNEDLRRIIHSLREN